MVASFTVTLATSPEEGSDARLVLDEVRLDQGAHLVDEKPDDPAVRPGVDKDGNLCFPNGLVKDRESLYVEAVDTLFGKGKKMEGLVVSQP